MNSSNNNNNSTATPMELGAINQHKPLTQAVKDFRKNNQLCLYCGGKGHFNNNCPNKKKTTSGILSLIIEGDNEVISSSIDDSIITGKRRRVTNLLETLEIGEIKKVAISKSDSIIVLPVTLHHGDNEEDATGADALVDTGAIHNFVSLEWADYLGVPIEKFSTENRTTYRLADGTSYTCKACCAITMRLNGTHHEETTDFRTLETCFFPIILGMEWMKKHQPTITSNGNKVNMKYLTTTCTPLDFDVGFASCKRPFRVSSVTPSTSISLVHSSPATLTSTDPLPSQSFEQYLAEQSESALPTY